MENQFIIGITKVIHSVLFLIRVPNPQIEDRFWLFVVLFVTIVINEPNGFKSNINYIEIKINKIYNF